MSIRLDNPDQKTLDTIKPLTLKNRLAPTPQQEPLYKVQIKNKKGDDISVADPRVTRALVALMNQHAVHGGAAAHWGGPAAFAEIMSCLHWFMFQDKSIPWNEKYNFVNDAGHTENGVYALRANYGYDNLSFEDLYKFRSINSKLTGHGEAHLNPEGVYVSNGPLGSGLPQAQGLAVADKAIGLERTTLCTISDGASMEGEAKESFAAIPGFAARGMLNPFLMVVSDNNTKLSGRIDKDAFSMDPTFTSLETLGWEVIFVQEGNNLQEVYNAIEKGIEMAKNNPRKPVCLLCRTVKGFGVKSTEDSASGGHGYPLKAYSDKLDQFIKEVFEGNVPEEFQKTVEFLSKKPEAKASNEKKVLMDKVQPGFARATIKAAKEGLPVFSVSADLQGSTGINAFQKEFPGRYVDVGVAESNAVSTAVGLSKQGLIGIVDTFAQFGITKGNLPLIMSGLSEAPIIGLYSHTGFQDAADGASHQATTYLAATSSIPHVQCVVVSCQAEAESLMSQAITNIAKGREEGKKPDSVLFFYGREKHPISFDEKATFNWGKAQILKKGKDVTFITCGPLLPKALAASELLEKEGLSATVINNAFVNRPDVETIESCLRETKGRVITLEDHQLVGGMGAQLTHALSLKNIDFKIKCLAIKGGFGQSAYLADHLYELHGLDEKSLVTATKDFLKN
ncbi:thiamine pyrophosphate-dependent enzyme [Bacteriovoracales bacterium]|nr:thiamine pyrophosphate-dependent enzyme [Bacteriovoracales bacterium]